jgi:hypothetical protein
MPPHGCVQGIIARNRLPPGNPGLFRLMADHRVALANTAHDNSERGPRQARICFIRTSRIGRTFPESIFTASGGVPLRTVDILLTGFDAGQIDSTHSSGALPSCRHGPFAHAIHSHMPVGRSRLRSCRTGSSSLDACRQLAPRHPVLRHVEIIEQANIRRHEQTVDPHAPGHPFIAGQDRDTVEIILVFA